MRNGSGNWWEFNEIRKISELAHWPWLQVNFHMTVFNEIHETPQRFHINISNWMKCNEKLNWFAWKKWGQQYNLGKVQTFYGALYSYLLHSISIKKSEPNVFNWWISSTSKISTSISLNNCCWTIAVNSFGTDSAGNEGSPLIISLQGHWRAIYAFKFLV